MSPLTRASHFGNYRFFEFATAKFLPCRKPGASKATCEGNVNPRVSRKVPDKYLASECNWRHLVR